MINGSNGDFDDRLSYIRLSDEEQDTTTTTENAPHPRIDLPSHIPGVKYVSAPVTSHIIYGLYFQYAVIGVIHAFLPLLAYPIFTIYLRMEGYQIAAYQQLVTFGWAFRPVFAMLTDCIPIRGYRRKAWIMLGWLICTVSFGVLAFSSVGDAYCDLKDDFDCWQYPANLTSGHYNVDAPNHAGRFIVLSGLASIGYVLVATVTDAFVVEWTAHEPEDVRHHIRSYIYGIRAVWGGIANIAGGLCLNGSRYSGSFSLSMAPNLVYGLCQIVCLVGGLTAMFLIKEIKHSSSTTPVMTLAEWQNQFWALVERPLVYHTCLYRFLACFFMGFHSTAMMPMALAWARVEPMNFALSSVLGNLVFGGTLLGMSRWGRNWRWRWTVTLATVATILIDAGVTMLTTWDYLRNQWFFTFVGFLERAPDAARFAVATQCLEELAEPGTELLALSLLSSVTNIATTLSTAIYKYVDGFYSVSMNDLFRDDHIARMEVTNTYAIAYACKFSALFWVFFLPSNREKLLALKQRSDKPNRLAAYRLVILLVVSLIFATSAHVMAVYPSTSCHQFGGGNGRDTAHCD
ncbi:unnamed protein product [Aphanomyces euteiches]|uniref:Major facilitator superfamily associated domain-containing protein n=1 Tax=Aphanomyces euteiches TaxID=100861 RepID=A0A6G0XYI4_9STRA|nr:hypothetical protein Ae201684_000041 [Aphanomyces euteiches]KAH9091957.1 hypothetical protein Ae201684P_011498 [Aphanomyces euteiches]